jgi:excisionase family DNA binding protein
MSAHILPEVCTEHDAARFLQVNPSVIGRMCRAGKLPAVKVGRSWRILRKHILGIVLQ